jgi:hypothetical protein
MEEENGISYDEVIVMMNSLVGFYEQIDTIQDYFRIKKKEKVKDLDITDKLDTIFNDLSMSPLDMDISIEIVDAKIFNPMVQTICSMPLEAQMGRQVNIGVKENKTGTWLGFTRIASPVMRIKPRNILYGESVSASKVNSHMVNGCQIIPVQPFGYNYLGGKLLALISTSHEVREIFNNKYDGKCDILHWETTSLYGDIKGVSQYDGLKPFVRYVSLTESENFLFPTDEIYQPILKSLREYYGVDEFGGRLVEQKGSGPKMREFNKVISIIKSILKDNDMEIYNKFHQFTKEKMKSKTKKRFYYSNYGYDNVKEHMENPSILLEKGVNYDKFKLDNIIEWWKRKSFSRWTKLTEENRLKTELEIYTTESLKDNTFEMIR